MSNQDQALEQKNHEEIIDLRQYLAVLRRRWLSITSFTFIVALLAVLVVYSITPVYTSTAVLLIEADQNQAVSIEDIVGVDTSKKEYYQTQYEILRSRSVAQQVIDELNLADLPEFNGNKEKSLLDNLLHPVPAIKDFIKSFSLIQSLLPAVVEPSVDSHNEIIRQTVTGKFKANLLISPVRNTQMVNISYTSENPKLAASIANAVGQTYINSNREARLTAGQQATDWLTHRIGQLKSTVTDAELKLSQFLESEGLVDVSGIDSLASTELSDLSRRLSEARDRRGEAQSIYDLLKDSQGNRSVNLSSVSSISNHPQLTSIRAAEIDAEALVSELSKRYGPKHDRMIQAKAQLKSVQERSIKLIDNLASGIEKELQSALQQERAIQTELNSKKGEFQNIAIKRASYDALKREVETNRKLYDLFVTRQKETSATGDFLAAVARFTDYAVIPLIPAKPRKSRIVGLATIAGCMFAIILAFLGDALRNTIENAGDIEEKLRVSPLGTMPLLTNSKFKNGLMADVFFDVKDARGFAESVRSIRTALTLKFMNNARKLIAVTSSVPGEGKSTIAINLAQSMAKMEKTLLIDCDLRKPSLADRFKLPKTQQGLTNILVMGADLDECIYHHELSGLSVLTAGMVTPNPQELLASDAFKTLLSNLAERFDKIIIDTPPVAAVSDAMIIGGMVGSSILVVKAGSTKVNQVKRTVSQMISHKVGIDGVILNQVSAKTQKEYGYYGYYDYGTKES